VIAQPVGVDEPLPRRLPLPALVAGGASTLFGTVLFLLWIQQRVAPKLVALPPFPFFDRLVLWSRPMFGPLGWNANSTFVVLHLLAAGLLLVAGWALLTRQRLALPLFVLPGWGGFIVTLAALRPGDNMRFKLRTLMNMAQKSGAPADASIWDMIPASVYVWGGLFFVLWVFLLVTGTVHLLRNREVYER
jgi:hypothetical protein